VPSLVPPVMGGGIREICLKLFQNQMFPERATVVCPARAPTLGKIDPKRLLIRKKFNHNRSAAEMGELPFSK
jgi:hypothetical protein